MAGERLDNEERDWSEDGKKVKQKERQKRKGESKIKTKKKSKDKNKSKNKNKKPKNKDKSKSKKKEKLKRENKEKTRIKNKKKNKKKKTKRKKAKIRTKAKRKMKASRRSRGAREMEKKRGKREAEKKKHKGKRRNAGSSPGLRSAPVVAKPTSTGRRATRQPCRLHPRAKLRFAFGLLVGKAAAGRKKWRALGKWWDEIGVGGTERRKPGGWRGRWRLVDFGKMVGRNVRRRPAKPGGRKLAG